MKSSTFSLKYGLLIGISLVLAIGCSSDKNNQQFIEKTKGRYLFNANEILEIRFEDAILYAKWRGKENIKPLKVNDSSFYMAELNEKLIFLDNPVRIVLAEKTEHKGVKYIFEKLAENEKTPSEYIADKDFENALIAFKKIQKKDSINPVIREYNLIRLANSFHKGKDDKTAIEIRKITTKLYPKSSISFSSLGFAYWKVKDTTNAIESYKKALKINPENRLALRFFKKHKFD